MDGKSVVIKRDRNKKKSGVEVSVRKRKADDSISIDVLERRFSRVWLIVGVIVSFSKMNAQNFNEFFSTQFLFAFPLIIKYVICSPFLVKRSKNYITRAYYSVLRGYSYAVVIITFIGIANVISCEGKDIPKISIPSIPSLHFEGMWIYYLFCIHFILLFFVGTCTINKSKILKGGTKK